MAGFAQRHAMTFAEILSNLRDAVMAPSLTPIIVAGTLGSVLFAALLRGFTGFGFALAGVPLLSQFIAPAHAVPIAVLLQFFLGFFDWRTASKQCHWPSLGWLSAGAAVGSPIGAFALSAVPAPIARIVIAIVLVIAVATLGRGFALEKIPGRMVTLATGFVSGLFNGLAAMSGPPVVIYYMSGPFGRLTVRASLMIFFFVVSAVALVSMIPLGLISAEVLILSALSAPMLLIGTWLGSLGFHHGSERLHRNVSIVMLAVIALTTLAKGVSEIA